MAKTGAKRSRLQKKVGLVSNGADYLLANFHRLGEVAWERYSAESLDIFGRNTHFNEKFGNKISEWKMQKMHTPVKGVADVAAFSKPLKWRNKDGTPSKVEFSDEKIGKARKGNPYWTTAHADPILEKAKEIESKYFSRLNKKKEKGDKDKEDEKENEIIDSINKGVLKYGAIADASKKREYTREGDAEMVVRIEESFVNELDETIRNKCEITSRYKVVGVASAPDTLIISKSMDDVICEDEVDFKDSSYFNRFEKHFKSSDALAAFWQSLPKTAKESEDTANELNRMSLSDDNEEKEKGINGLHEYRALSGLTRAVRYASESNTRVIFHDYNRFAIFAFARQFNCTFVSPVYHCANENISFVSLLLAIMQCPFNSQDKKCVELPRIANRKPLNASDWLSRTTLDINVTQKFDRSPLLVGDSGGKEIEAPKSKAFALSMMDDKLTSIANGEEWSKEKLFYFDCGVFGIFDSESERGDYGNPIRGVYDINAQLVAIIHVVDSKTVKEFEGKENEGNAANSKVVRMALARGCSNVVISDGTRSVMVKCYPIHSKGDQENDACGGLAILSSSKENVWEFINKLCVVTKGISYNIGKIAQNEEKKDESTDAQSQTIGNNEENNNDASVNDNNKETSDAASGDTSNDTSMDKPMASEARTHKASEQGERNDDKKKNEFEKMIDAFKGDYWQIWKLDRSNGGSIIRGKRKSDGKYVFIKYGPSTRDEYKQYGEMKKQGFGKYLPNEFAHAVIATNEEYIFGLVIEDCGLPIIKSSQLNQEQVYEIRDLLKNKLKEHNLEHNDFAGRNVLFDEKTKKITVIDWDNKKRSQRKDEFIYNPMTQEQKKWYYFDENKKYSSFRII